MEDGQNVNSNNSYTSKSSNLSQENTGDNSISCQSNSVIQPDFHVVSEYWNDADLMAVNTSINLDQPILSLNNMEYSPMSLALSQLLNNIEKYNATDEDSVNSTQYQQEQQWEQDSQQSSPNVVVSGTYGLCYCDYELDDIPDYTEWVANLEKSE